MAKKKVLWSVFAAALAAFALLQFVPAPAVVIPATLPTEQRDAQRLLAFEGIANFRDLGGYRSSLGGTVKWGVLYRSGNLSKATVGDLENVSKLGLKTLVDFRSATEKEAEPDRLPESRTFDVVEIPILDSGNNSLVNDLKQRLDSGDFSDFDPDRAMLDANRQFATTFTPQFRRFIDAVAAADGSPVLWHCTAGKDRAGFAAAVLLRILGVPVDTVMQDYMASNAPSLAAHKQQLWLLRLFKGAEAADKLEVMMGVDANWLRAAFTEIDRRWGSFDRYLSDGLQLDEKTIGQLRSTLLE